MGDYKKVIVQLRGEIGEVINSWLLFRHFSALRSKQMTGDVSKDMQNRSLGFLGALSDKLRAEIVARLSELSSTVRKGRLNFENASRQLGTVGLNICKTEVEALRAFLKSHSFEEKRNTEISHKSFTADWKDEVGPVQITKSVLSKAISLSIRAMKHMDREVYGLIHSQFMWRELRKKRYELFHPAAAFYMIAEHIHIPEAVRAGIINAELAAGKFHQELMEAEVNGTKVQVYASKKWGAINFGGQLMILPQYPLQSIGKIEGSGIVVDPAWTEGEDSL